MGSKLFSPTPRLSTPNLVYAGTVSRLIHASDDVTTPSLPFFNSRPHFAHSEYLRNTFISSSIFSSRSLALPP